MVHVNCLNVTRVLMQGNLFTRRAFPLFLCPAMQSPQVLIHRSYKFKRSFLSDEEGVNNFIALLGPYEKKQLHDALSRSLKDITIPETDGSESNTCSPTVTQLRLVFIHQMLPFVGFGFLDNLIMILAGEYLDVTIGVTLGISTMAAAGLGNAISDVAGIGSAWYVGKLAAQVGVKHPNLSKAQIEMKSTKIATQMGRAIGVLIGCIIGMFPLLFMSHSPRDEHNDDEKDQKKTAKDSQPAA